MQAALHTHGGRTVLALCDADILGKVYEDGDAILDLASNFYKGKEVDAANASAMITSAHIIHAVGKESTTLLKTLGVISGKELKKIDGIPHVQVVQ